jgi:hypothetical protein
MEKVMPSFEYERLILFPELETLDEEENKRDTMGQDYQVQEFHRS